MVLESLGGGGVMAEFEVMPHHSVGRVAQSVQRQATGWTVRGSNPGEDEIFRTCPERLWDPRSLL